MSSGVNLQFSYGWRISFYLLIQTQRHHARKAMSRYTRCKINWCHFKTQSRNYIAVRCRKTASPRKELLLIYGEKGVAGTISNMLWLLCAPYRFPAVSTIRNRWACIIQSLITESLLIASAAANGRNKFKKVRAARLFRNNYRANLNLNAALRPSRAQYVSSGSSFFIKPLEPLRARYLSVRNEARVFIPTRGIHQNAQIK